MKITNKLNLPEPIYRACQNDDYTKGKADYSVTQLLRPSWMNHLSKKHGEIEKDCSQMLYALMGKAMHEILNNDNIEYLQEHRFNCKISGKTISGQIDLYDFKNLILYDYKFASVWEYIHGIKDDKIQQLNIYKMLLRADVQQLKIVFLFRDWSQTKANFDNEYPQSQIAVVDVPVWKDKKIFDFVKNRVKIMDGPVPCTKEEKWCRDEKWAVMKKGRKSAVRLFGNEIDASSFILNDKSVKCAKDYTVEYRKGENTRCKYYCDVARFCEYKDI